MFAPMIDGPETTKEMLTAFGGYNHNLKIVEGEWYDEENLCTDHYPVMSPALMPIAVDRATYTSGGQQVYPALSGCGITSFTDKNGTEHYAYVQPTSGASDTLYKLCIDDAYTNLVLDPATVKQFVLMGTYLLVFPDKKYINVNDRTEYGEISEKIKYGGTQDPTAKNGGLNLKFTPCDGSGNAITGYTTSATAPQNPSDGDLWLDISEEPHLYKRYSSANGMWLGVSDVYVFVEEDTDEIEIHPPSDYFNEGDGITLEYIGTSLTTDDLSLNGSHIVQKSVGGGIIIIGTIDEPFSTSGGAYITRSVPDMDYVCECNNRIWGCKFGVVDGKNINELYCSKLGDFKNWEVYEGLSTDSWRASVGAEGAWTGCIAYNGYPTFFKENSIHKIYISSTGAHQVVMTSADGISNGSWRSTVIINGVLFYLSYFGVMAYTGTLPTKISEQITFVLTEGVAGALNKYYYLTAKNNTTLMTFVYDTELQVWHKVKTQTASMYAPMRHRLFYEDTQYNNIGSINTRDWNMVEMFTDWYAISGVIGFAYPENKYLSRFVFRMDLAKDSWCEMFIEYDSNGQWYSKGRMYRPGLQSFVLPVMPRRCDHCRIKLVGYGDFKLYSMSKILEVGSDY